MTLPTQADIVSQMRQGLAAADPTIDTSIGTPLRKILDVVGSGIFGAQADAYLLNYVYDVDTKSGADLDNFVASIAGMTRLPAKRSTGSVVFGRTSPATQDYFIPLGSQVATQDSVPVVALTTAAALLSVGDTEIEVAVQSVMAGSLSNVQANTLVVFINPVAGVMNVTNPEAMTGGADAESDDALRTRFKKSVLRNLAGTVQMFTGVALDNPNVSQVNVVGATKVHREQMAITSHTGTSGVNDAVYIYPNTTFFGTDLDTGTFFTEGSQWETNNATPPVITVADTVNIPDGVYDLEFEYLSNASRNDPTNGITNRVDVWVDGMDEQNAVENLPFRTALSFNNTSTDPLYHNNFVRNDGTHPTVGNWFVRLSFSPVVDPLVGVNTIIIGGETYTKNTNLFVVQDITPQGRAPRSRSGLELVSHANSGPTDPADLSPFTIEYSYNAVPTNIESAMDLWRLVTTDVWVHAATLFYLNFYLAVILTPGYTMTNMAQTVGTALTSYMETIDFDGVLQTSDIIAVVHSVPGIDSVRFLRSDDQAHFGIERIDPDNGNLITNFNDSGSPQRAKDILFNDDQLPIMNEVFLVQKAQNNFGIL